MEGFRVRGGIYRETAMTSVVCYKVVCLGLQTGIRFKSEGLVMLLALLRNGHSPLQF